MVNVRVGGFTLRFCTRMRSPRTPSCRTFLARGAAFPQSSRARAGRTPSAVKHINTQHSPLASTTTSSSWTLRKRSRSNKGEQELVLEHLEGKSWPAREVQE